jgi:putative transposase
MQQAQIKTERGYNRKTRYDSGELSNVAPNLLNREFDASKPNTVWVTDITYIRTYEGWLFQG